jgi:hypothetical protein
LVSLFCLRAYSPDIPLGDLAAREGKPKRDTQQKHEKAHFRPIHPRGHARIPPTISASVSIRGGSRWNNFRAVSHMRRSVQIISIAVHMSN